MPSKYLLNKYSESFWSIVGNLAKYLGSTSFGFEVGYGAKATKISSGFCFGFLLSPGRRPSTLPSSQLSFASY